MTLHRRWLLGGAVTAPLALLGCTGDGDPVKRDPISCAQGGNAAPQDMSPPDPEVLINPDLAFSGDRSEVAALHGSATVVWSTDSGQIVRSTGTSRVNYSQGQLAWNPQQPMLATDSCAAQVQFLDATDWSTRGVLTGHTEIEAIPMSMGLQYITFSPDGETAATCAYDGLVKLWRTSDQAELHSIESVASDGVQYLRFSPDGQRLLGSSLNHPPVVWDVGTAEEITVMDHVEQAIRPGWSPDGTRIAFSDWSGRLHLVDGESLAPLEALEFSVRPKESAWTADGTHIVMATETADELTVWEVGSPDVTRLASPGIDMVHRAAAPNEFFTSSGTHGIQKWTVGDSEPMQQFELPVWED